MDKFKNYFIDFHASREEQSLCCRGHLRSGTVLFNILQLHIPRMGWQFFVASDSSLKGKIVDISSAAEAC